MKAGVVLVLVPLLLGTGAMAQSSEARDEVANLATVTVTHDLCGFDLSAAEEDAIARRRDGLVENGDVTAAEIADIEASLAASMKRQVAEGLCRPGGPAATFYRRTLDGLAAR